MSAAVSSSPACPDNALMGRIQRGDLSAFETLVNKYKQPVFNFVSRTLGGTGDAEDVAQTVFIQVFRSAARYEGAAKFASWIFTIARNLCLNEIRRRSRHPTSPLESGPGAPDEPCSRQFEDPKMESPLHAVLGDEMVHHLERALGELPEAQRTALILFSREELSYQEIAQVLGTSLGATRSLIHRGRERIKARMQRYFRASQNGCGFGALRAP